MLQRPDKINVLLASALNWQESAAIAIFQDNLTLRADNAVRAKEVALDALEKLTFLQDALIYALRDLRFSQESAPDFNFWEEINNLVEGLPDARPGTDHDADHNYFYVVALAKLFRALLSTRSGHPEGLPWGQRFSYPKTRDIHGTSAIVAKLTPYLRRRWNTTRLTTFVEPGATDAAVLAAKLLYYANVFLDFCDQLASDQTNVLRAAVQSDSAFDPKQLLPIWEVARASPYNCLPLDKLWKREADCVYLRDCIGFGEFAALKTRCDDVTARLAKDRRRYLMEHEATLTSDLQQVARNWWSWAFKNGMYRWRNRTQIDKNIIKDLENVMTTIKSPATYRRVSKHDAIRTRGHHIDVTRAACEGASPADIYGRFRSLQSAVIYSFLFTVATTPKSPKLQDCWHRSELRMADDD